MVALKIRSGSNFQKESDRRLAPTLTIKSIDLTDIDERDRYECHAENAKNDYKQKTYKMLQWILAHFGFQSSFRLWMARKP